MKLKSLGKKTKLWYKEKVPKRAKKIAIIAGAVLLAIGAEKGITEVIKRSNPYYKEIEKYRKLAPKNDLFAWKFLKYNFQYGYAFADDRTGLRYQKKAGKVDDDYFAYPKNLSKNTTYINYFQTPDKVHLLSPDHKHAAYVKCNPSGKNNYLLSATNIGILTAITTKSDFTLYSNPHVTFTQAHIDQMVNDLNHSSAADFVKGTQSDYIRWQKHFNKIRFKFAVPKGADKHLAILRNPKKYAKTKLTRKEALSPTSILIYDYKQQKIVTRDKTTKNVNKYLDQLLAENYVMHSYQDTQISQIKKRTPIENMMTLSNNQNNRASYFDASNAFSGQPCHYYYEIAGGLLLRDDSIIKLNGKDIPVIIGYNPNYDDTKYFQHRQEAKKELGEKANYDPSIKYDPFIKKEHDPFIARSLTNNWLEKIVPGSRASDLSSYRVQPRDPGEIKTNGHALSFEEDMDFQDTMESYNSVSPESNQANAGDIYALADKLSNKKISCYYIIVNGKRKYLPVYEGPSDNFVKEKPLGKTITYRGKRYKLKWPTGDLKLTPATNTVISDLSSPQNSYRDEKKRLYLRVKYRSTQANDLAKRNSRLYNAETALDLRAVKMVMGRYIHCTRNDNWAHIN